MAISNYCLTFAPANEKKAFGRLAQLVQSICLTSRGSAVRIRQRPQHTFRRFPFIEVCLRAFSSAGSEHLPYKQRVGGSNPSTPTKIRSLSRLLIYFRQPSLAAIFLGAIITLILHGFSINFFHYCNYPVYTQFTIVNLHILHADISCCKLVVKYAV